MFPLPQLKRSATLINKNYMHELPNGLRNDLWLFKEKLKNTCNYSLNEKFVNDSKKSLKTFPVYSYFP